MTQFNFRKRAVDTAAINDGVFFEIIDEIDGSSWGKFKLRYVDPTSASYKLATKRRWARLTQADKTRLQHPKTEADIEFSINFLMGGFIENNLIDWEGVLDDKGKEVKFSPEAAKALFTAERWLFDELDTLAGNITNFRAVAKEEIAKN